MVRDLREILLNYSLKTKVFIYLNQLTTPNSNLKDLEQVKQIYFSKSLKNFNELNFLENDRLNIFFSEVKLSDEELKLLNPSRFQICVISEMTQDQLRILKIRGYVHYFNQRPFGSIFIISDFINGFPSLYLERLKSPKLVDLISEPPDFDYECPR